MILRRIIDIDEERCNGCGACAEACHEGAIVMIDNKARLMRDDYCDGLGDCLPACPMDAIHFVEREALPFDVEAVKIHLKQKEEEKTKTVAEPTSQFPIQIKLMPVNSPLFDGAKLLIAADCSAFMCRDFHDRFMKGHVTVIGCPKLDQVDYTLKLTDIIRENNIRSVTIVRMQVPCCGGLSHMATEALKRSGKFIPWQIVTLSTDGDIIDAS